MGSADSASFPKVVLRKIRVVLAKGSKVLRALRGEKETQMEVEKPMSLLLQPRENLFEASLANLAGTGPICLRGVLAELSELETARSGQPMRTGTLMDAEGYAVSIVFLGENADVGEGIYVYTKTPR